MLKLERRTEWKCPETNDVRILTMPNLPRPCHGGGLQPRTIYGRAAWDKTRKRCYVKANFKCEACGADVSASGAAQCLERGTQVLTSDGWKNIEDISLNDSVAQFTPEDQAISFVKPLKTFSHFEEKIVDIGYKKGFSMGVSADHRVLVKNKRDGSWRVYTAKDVPVTWPNYIPAGGKGRGDDELSIDERLMIALQADGTRKQNKSTGEYCFTIRVKKERKIERLKWLVPQSSFRHTEIRERDLVGFRVWVDKNCKLFSECFSYEMSYKKANAFIEELVKWDGWEGVRKAANKEQSGRCYYSSEEENIKFVQAIAAQAGLGSHITVVHRNFRNWGRWHASQTPSTNLKPAYNLEIKKKAEYGMTTMSKKVRPYNDYVFCIQVPSSFFVARTRGGDVFVTGNCHELFDIDYEAGTSTYVRCACLCKNCHILTIHNGRALTLFKQGNPLYRAEVLLKAAESSFKAVHDWNVAHPGETPLKMYATFAEYLKEPELAAGMQDLIAKYHIKFWVEDKKKFADWGKWKVIVDGKDYPTPYASYDDWVTAMQKESLNDPERQVSNPFSGGVYDEIKEFLKGEK